MNGIVALVNYLPHPAIEQNLHRLTQSPYVGRILIISNGNAAIHPFKTTRSKIIFIHSEKILQDTLLKMNYSHLLLINSGDEIHFDDFTLRRFIDVAEATGAGMVYSDYNEMDGVSREHPVNDYQAGSIRDDFSFGPIMFFSLAAVKKVINEVGVRALSTYAGIYDLRLKVSIDHSLFHIQEFLYKVKKSSLLSDNSIFSYVDPKNSAIQKEMETICTEYLQRIGAYLTPRKKKAPRTADKSFPVKASVIIPVKNRKKTIADAVKSALAQKTDFPFNVVVVDNHSTDGTSSILASLAAKNPVVEHIMPSRPDLGIGGCWNEAIYSDACGFYAVQLDSDDLYSGNDTLQMIIDLFAESHYAMIVGSYTLVDKNLLTIPPGLIDHREWTDDNGHNNALRINGLGAPRAFHTGTVRDIGFLNVSYGEDYAMALRLSREWKIGRIYESLYMCRRWEDNTDAALSVEKSNRHDAFKDKIRSIEIAARQAMNRKKSQK
jgi:hypothetical protein